MDQDIYHRLHWHTYAFSLCPRLRETNNYSQLSLPGLTIPPSNFTAAMKTQKAKPEGKSWQIWTTPCLQWYQLRHDCQRFGKKVAKIEVYGPNPALFADLKVQTCSRESAPFLAYYIFFMEKLSDNERLLIRRLCACTWLKRVVHRFPPQECLFLTAVTPK